MFTDVFVKIIEEISEGFLILNHDHEILFFNEVLLKMLDLRSRDILIHEKEFLGYLNIPGILEGEKSLSIPNAHGVSRDFLVRALQVQSQDGHYILVKVSEEGGASSRLVQLYQKNYKRLFNNIGDALFTADLDGNILTANKAFFELTGYNENAKLKDLSSLYIYHDDLEEKLMRLVEGKALYNLETHIYTKTGGIKRVLDTSWIVKSESGAITGYVTQFKDVTYLKSIESRLMISERNFTILFDTIISSIIIVDPEGTIVNLNAAAESMYGYSWDDTVGEKFDFLFRYNKEQPSLMKIIGKVKENKGRYIETEVRRNVKDGGLIYTFASYAEILDLAGEVIAYSIVEKDLTERIHLEQKLRESIAEVKETQAATIMGFARLTEYRDKNTGKHLERIREFTRVLAIQLRELPKFRDYITDQYIEDIALSSTLHDVGKVGIEDRILLKDGRLTREEYERIKEHSLLGGSALEAVQKELNKESFLTLGKEIAYYHHEHWDGTGYPDGLKGEEIPLSARIVAIADVYDALLSKRPYKKSYSHSEAVEIIRQGRGTQFDPLLTDIFLKNQEIYHRISRFIEFEANPINIEDIIHPEEGR